MTQLTANTNREANDMSDLSQSNLPRSRVMQELTPKFLNRLLENADYVNDLPKTRSLIEAVTKKVLNEPYAVMCVLIGMASALMRSFHAILNKSMPWQFQL